MGVFHHPSNWEGARYCVLDNNFLYAAWQRIDFFDKYEFDMVYR
jgi:hypothetical protein